MDIETIKTWLPIVKDLATTLAALTAAVIGIIGLQTWKKQLRGKTEYELAQQLAKTVYTVRDAIAEFRKPFSAEMEIRKTMNQGLEGKQINNPKLYASTAQSVYNRRWQTIQDAMRDLDTISLEAEAIWGIAVIRSLVSFRLCVFTVQQAMDQYLHHLLNLSPLDELEKSTREVIDHFYPYGEVNQFSDRINNAVRQIENFLKPYLRI